MEVGGEAGRFLVYVVEFDTIGNQGALVDEWEHCCSSFVGCYCLGDCVCDSS